MINQDYGHITPELLEQVKDVLADAANHKYSTSKVYGAYNQVFKLSEKPESCASCLRKRASALKMWYGEYLLSEVNKELPKQKDGVVVDTILGKAVVSPELAQIAAASATLGNSDHALDAAGMVDPFTLTTKADDKEILGDPVSGLKLIDKNGNAVDVVFNSEEGVKGVLNTIDGKAVKPGTYTTAEGATYTVQPGGKATLKDDLL